MCERKAVFTDGEGPIVFLDLAQELVARFVPDGKRFFAALSSYDDFLTETAYPGYQAGDTLSLVVPHLLIHGVSDADVWEEAKKARMVNGVKTYFDRLRRDGCDIRIISTAYRPLWDVVADALDFPTEQIACTELSLDTLQKIHATSAFYQAVDDFEQRLLPMLSRWEAAMRDVEGGASIKDVFCSAGAYADIERMIHTFYWERLPSLGFHPLAVVPVMGGERKIGAARTFARALDIPLRRVVYVGDSITDAALFRVIGKEGGLAIAVNASIYALKDAHVAVVTEDMRGLLPLFDAWWEGGLVGVETFIQSSGRGVKNVHYTLVNRDDQSSYRNLLKIHKEYRRRVRGAAAVLG